MQSKNNIKQLFFLILALFLGEGIFGLGLFWPFLLAMKDKKYVFWLTFACGLVLNAIYSKGFGLMSLFLLVVLSLVYLFVNTGRSNSWWIVLASLLVNFIFDFAFGLQWSIWEVLALVVVSFFVSKDQDTRDTIKITYK